MRVNKEVEQEGVFIKIRGARSVHREMKKPTEEHSLPKRVGRSGASNPTEIGSELFGQNVVFLSPNNTELLAHQGSSVTLSCRLTKSPNFGMVSNVLQKNCPSKKHCTHIQMQFFCSFACLNFESY